MQILLTLFISLLFAIDIESVPYRFRVDNQNGIDVDEERNDILDYLENENPNIAADLEDWEADYHQVHISNLLKEYPKMKQIFNTSSSSENFNGYDIMVNNMDLCKSYSISKLSPKTYKNIHKVPKIIVNQDDVQQTISETWCMNKGGKCSDTEKLDASSVCKQNFSRIRLLIYNQKDRRLEWDDFDIPCGCVCVWNKKDSFFRNI